MPAGASEMILLTEENPYTLSLGTIFEFPVPEGLPSPTSGLRLSVELTDYDGGSDDFIGRDEVFIELFEILSSTDDSLTYSIELSENNRVRVEFTIERL
ncbi:C2 domain-containing protein [Salinigranum halophilum]|uniref:hypothetical protein n=1 Tax=Salinigranum halophilum TaxID=2565931 RepID=UPI001F2C360C|nr:hypothetical protein [Salinigranum halophilum]